MPSARAQWARIPDSKHTRLPGVPAERTKFDEPIEITVRVRARGPRDTRLSPGGALARREFEAVWGADPKDLAMVKAFAKRYGLSVRKATAASRSVVLSGRPAALERAFRIRLSHHRSARGVSHAVDGEVSIPKALLPIVEGVLGLDTQVATNPAFRHWQRQELPRPKYLSRKLYTPREIAQLYDFPPRLTGRGQCIGLIEFGGGYRNEDIALFCNRLGIPTPEITAIAVDGARNLPTTPSRDSEVMLDIEVACAVAPGAKIAVYFTPPTSRGLLDALMEALHDEKNSPSVISISWGALETAGHWSKNDMNVINGALEEAAHLGITVCCASGDNGSSSGTRSGLAVNFPASSPYTLACGGTRVDASRRRIARETAWKDSGGASGGGVSSVFPLPRWQQDARVRLRPGSRPLKKRGLPDVAGSASPATGYPVRVDGTWLPHVGGTSAVAPLWAGLIARINERLGRRVGYLTPLLYERDGPLNEVCRDIRRGSNGVRHYRAGRGWDACTGWGSPHGTKLMQALHRRLQDRGS